MSVRVFDNLLTAPKLYRDNALRGEFKTYSFPEVGVSFHNISNPAPSYVADWLAERYPVSGINLTFFRKSPVGQVEPHFIHTDADMGDWTAVLYLNPNPPAEDGTTFWRYRPTGRIKEEVPHRYTKEGYTPNSNWEPWNIIKAEFNRLILFPSTYFHSRSIFDNWSSGGDDRLIQVTFGTGDLWGE